MRLESVLFPGNFPERYRRMADVLRASAAENSPATPLTIHEISEPDDEIEQLARPNIKRAYINNARKAKHHNQIIQEAKNGEVLCMIDADTMVLDDLSEVEAMDFDLAYTVRPPQCKWKINTGVYFVRVSANVKAVCRDWQWLVNQLLGNASDHDYWRKVKRYGGIHQAALGCLIEQGNYLRRNLVPIPCETYNCVSGCWNTATNPKVVHIMGAMRDWCLGTSKCKDAGTNRWVDRWQQYDTKGEFDSLGVQMRGYYITPDTPEFRAMQEVIMGEYGLGLGLLPDGSRVREKHDQ